MSQRGNWAKIDHQATRRVEHEGCVWDIDCKLIGNMFKVYRVYGDVNRMKDLVDGIDLELAAHSLRGIDIETPVH